jgi:hemoglobin-like flavoprotein
MSSESRYRPGADMQGFVRELMEFVELSDADVAIIRRTAPVILRHEQALTAALYEHFLKFPATARFFLKEDGTQMRNGSSGANIALALAA